MGDRTWLSITFPKIDRHVFKNVFGFDEPEEECDNNDGTLRWQMFEMNYGGYDFISELASNKLTFNANSGSGDEYGPMAYACFKGELIEINTDHEGWWTIRIDKDGINQHDLDEYQKYFKLREKIDNHFKYIAKHRTMKKHGIIKQTMSLWGI
jgi:hypothetical protein